jgi:hypothetical protein
MGSRRQSSQGIGHTREHLSTMNRPTTDPGDSRAESTDLGRTTASRIHRIALGLCWGGLVLFALSLIFPALRLQGKGEWVAGDLGFSCLILSFDRFPCWVPHALTMAAPFVCGFAGATVKKAVGVVLALATLSVLQWVVPEVINIGFGQGVLAGFWIWALALITSSAGLLIGGFLSRDRTSTLAVPVARAAVPERSRRAILLCWAGLILLIVTGLLGRSFVFLGVGARPASGAGIMFALYRFVVPTLLAMAPLVCKYASRRTQTIIALGLLVFGVYQVASYSMFLAGTPSVAVLHAYLSSWLTAGLAVSGLVVSAGLPGRYVRALRAPSPLTPLPVGARGTGKSRDSGLTPSDGTSESTFSRDPSALGSALCWLALANALGLGSLPFALIRANESVDTLIQSIFLNPYFGYSVLAMAPLVCTFAGPLARRIVGGLLALQAVGIILLIAMTPVRFYGLPDLIAFSLGTAGLLWVDVSAGTRTVLGRADRPKAPLVEQSGG